MTMKRWLSLLMAALLVLALTACGGKGGDADNKDDGGKGESAVINAVEYGVDNTGKTDMTDKMIAMHKEGAKNGKPIYYPNGTYLFNGATLDFTSGVQFESMDGVTVRNSVADTNIINFDDAGNLIGLMHNHLEMKYDAKNPDDFIVSGNLTEAPLSTAKFDTKLDFLVYWYNDFGLERTKPIPGSWNGWYDWQWNHHDVGTTCKAKLPAADGSEEGEVCGAKLPISDDPYVLPTCPECGAQSTTDQYDPTRHPLLGWYRGDEVEVLDWQCYWLQEYGIQNSVLLAGGWDESAWSDPTYGQYWVYNLLNNTKNAKQMNFALQITSNYNLNSEQHKAAWQKTFDTFYFKDAYKDMVYCYELDGKRYPLVFIWDENALSHGIGLDTVKQMYKDVAEMFKGHGYDGICIAARTPIFAYDSKAAIRAEMKEAGVLWYAADYPSNATNPWGGTTYEERTKFHPHEDPSRIFAVATGLHTHDPHPSQWVCSGNTPELFSNWVKNAVEETLKNPARPQMVTCYNMAEWSEGGPGLTPTVGDRFGYLEAIRDNIVVKQ